MILEIIQYPNDILHRVCDAVEKIDSEVDVIVRNMKETMLYSKGIGLAAIQVGIPKRIFIMEVTDDDVNQTSEDRQQSNNEVSPDLQHHNITVFINPVIIAKSGTIEYEEGCLSVKGIYAKVTRATDIEVKYQDETGKEHITKFSGLSAICIQHEIDHLDGIVFVEKLSRLKQDMIIRKIKKSHYEM